MNTFKKTIARRLAAFALGFALVVPAVALADLRGCGNSRAELHRGRHGRIQAASVSAWMLGDNPSDVKSAKAAGVVALAVDLAVRRVVVLRAVVVFLTISFLPE